jgi:hypothetical protein
VSAVGDPDGSTADFGDCVDCVTRRACESRASNHRRREIIIEDELMSVHSCAIVWQAVVIAHYRALKATANNHHRHYTEALAEEAATIAARPFHIHEWIAGDTTS